MNYTEQQAEWITQQILQELATSKKTAAPAAAPVALNIPVGVSNRHVHLCREDMDILFGYGSTLTRSKALKQPGQYAAEEMVTLRGPKGELNKVRVLGPLRNATQVEISVQPTALRWALKLRCACRGICWIRRALKSSVRKGGW